MSVDPPILYVHLGRRPLLGLAASVVQVRHRLPTAEIIVAKETDAGPRLPPGARARVVAVPPPSHRTRAFEAASEADRGFRDGFWFHTTRRLFVLADLMEHLGIERAIHLEGDCLPMLRSGDLGTLAAYRDRLLLPLSSEEAAMAVLLWIGSRSALASVLEAMLEDLRADPALNEMELLARAILGTAPADALPTAPNDSWLKPHRAHGEAAAAATRHFDEFGCVFDAAALGQYLGGQDPANEPGRPTTLHANQHSTIDPRRLSWRIDADAGSIEARSSLDPTGRWVRIANLHMHCKDFPPLDREGIPWFARRVDAANAARPLSGPRRTIRRGSVSPPRVAAVARRVGGSATTLGGILETPSEPLPTRLAAAGVRSMRRGSRLARHRLLGPIPVWHRMSYERQTDLLDRLLPVDPLADLPSAPEQIAIAIPCGPRDVGIAPLAVVAAIEAIEAGVAGVRLIAANPTVIDRSRLPADVEVVDEADIIDPAVRIAIAASVPPDRRGWVLQQLLKLRETALGTANATLIVDADTILLRPRTWLSGDIQTLVVSAEAHRPYAEHLDRLLGPSRPRLPLSAVAHHQLMQRDVLAAFFGSTAESFNRQALRYLEAARFDEASACAEYELYGTLLLGASPWRCRLARPAAGTFRRGDVDWSLPCQEIIAMLRERLPDAHAASAHWYAECPSSAIGA